MEAEAVGFWLARRKGTGNRSIRAFHYIIIIA